MHQTFYIDIDEEITSIVEKLRKAEASEVILVIPKRAMLIQSIVNLKLLRKEADNLGLKISIVTQDNLGKVLVKKAGISIQQKAEDHLEEISEVNGNHKNKERREIKKEIEHVELEDAGAHSKRNLEKIGSSEYFTPRNEEFEKISMSEKRGYEEKKNIIKRKKVSSMDVSVTTRPSVKKKETKTLSFPTALPHNDFSENYFSENPSGRENLKDKKLENFFYSNNLSNNNNHKIKKRSFGKELKIGAIIGAIALLCGISYGVYLYVPKATIAIFVKKEIKSADLEVTGDVNYSNIDYEKSVIPAKLMEFDEEVAKTFNATGTKNVSNKKARGKITIYNEFSVSPQPLVATTRFLSENQKTFRLVQGVIIPGTTKVGAEVKPGVVEAEIIADEPGDSYNIEPTKFSIPGFKNSGNEKYTKIYAQSSSAMTGGGNNNEEVKVISDKDISSAKDKISLEINSAIKKKIKDSVDAEIVILDDAIVVDEPVYRVSNSTGETAESFEIKAEAHARALVFSQSDIKKIANAVISKSGNGKANIDSGTVLVDYGKSVTDFKFGTIEIKMHASNVTQPNMNLEKIKDDILGKDSESLSEYLKTYPNIEKAEVEYWPPLFVSKVPSNKNRVEITVDSVL